MSDEEEQDDQDDEEEGDLCSHCGSPKKKGKENHESEAESTINNHSDEAEDEDNVRVCRVCGSTPCQWIDYDGEEILESLESKYDSTTAKDGFVLDYCTATSVPNAQVRYEAYKLFTFSLYGSLVEDINVDHPSPVNKRYDA